MDVSLREVVLKLPDAVEPLWCNRNNLVFSMIRRLLLLVAQIGLKDGGGIHLHLVGGTV